MFFSEAQLGRDVLGEHENPDLWIEMCIVLDFDGCYI